MSVKEAALVVLRLAVAALFLWALAKCVGGGRSDAELEHDQEWLR